MLNLVIREIEVRTTVRYCYTNTTMTILRKTENITFARIWKNVIIIAGKDIKLNKHSRK